MEVAGKMTLHRLRDEVKEDFLAVVTAVGGSHPPLSEPSVASFHLL